MSQISLENAEFFAHHGCFEEEQVIGNRFIIDFYCEVDTSEAEVSDDLSKTVDYQVLYELIREEMAVTSKLLEHVARRIIGRVMKAYPGITEAEVKISKLNPPLGGKVERVSVALSTLSGSPQDRDVSRLSHILQKVRKKLNRRRDSCQHMNNPACGTRNESRRNL